MRTVKQKRKTINNLRSRVKGRTNRNKTGNKPIKLSALEHNFLDLLEPTTNPVINRPQFGVSAGSTGSLTMDALNPTTPLPLTHSSSSVQTQPAMESTIRGASASTPSSSSLWNGPRKKDWLSHIFRGMFLKGRRKLPMSNIFSCSLATHVLRHENRTASAYRVQPNDRCSPASALHPIVVF